MRVLVVEDEATLRESLQARLGQAGFTVDVARDGEEGLFAGREYPLDIAVIDLGLPVTPRLQDRAARGVDTHGPDLAGVVQQAEYVQRMAVVVFCLCLHHTGVITLLDHPHRLVHGHSGARHHEWRCLRMRGWARRSYQRGAGGDGRRTQPAGEERGRSGSDHNTQA